MSAWPPRAPRGTKAPQPKKITFEQITRDSDVGAPVYERLDHLLATKRTFKPIVDAGARIVLAWATSWKRDVDGHLTLGKCKKASDLDRELAPFDFVILLNKAWWFDLTTSNVARDALLFHELKHAGVAYDEKGDIKEDERGRAVFRTVKHDLEEFVDTIAEFGFYKKDLEAFGDVCFEARAKVNAAGWVSYSQVHEQLQLAGVTIPLDYVKLWNGDELREVMTWAIIRADRRATPLLDATCVDEALPTPAIVQTALEQSRAVQ